MPLPNGAAAPCAKHVLEITFGIENLIKEFEKSMSCSMVTLYYFELQQKHEESLLSACFKTIKMVGDASFELATPAV